MLNKRRYLLIGLIIILLFIVFGLITVFKTIKVSENKNTTMKLNMDDNFCEIVREVAKINGNWENLPLSKEFKKKFNSKTGILQDDKITYLSWSTDNYDKEKQIVCLIVDHKDKSENYYIHYLLNDKNELDDVELIKKDFRIEYDEHGNEVDNDIEEYDPIALESDEFEDFVKRFCNEPNNAGDFSPRLWEWTLLSDNFIKKIKDSPFGVEYDDNPVLRTKVLDGTSYDDRIAYVEIDNGEKKERFKIIFVITEDGIFDDFEVEK